MQDRHGGDETSSPVDEAGLVVVGIGTSAGGVSALSAFFDALPGKTGAAFVVVAHLDPESPSELPRILAAHTEMPVEHVSGKTVLRADHVYVIPPNRQLEISDHEIAARPFQEPRGRRLPIDSFFRSLAEHHGDGFAIVLTGAGSDGAVGVKAIKETGGIILVQDPDEAAYPMMPRAAIAAGVVDIVLPVQQLAPRLTELIRAKRQGREQAQAADEEEGLRRILAHLRVRTGHDFSSYKRSTVLRRVSRRIQVTKKDNYDDYLSYLRDHADEAQLLLADLLVSVTTFFRDPSFFESLARNAIAPLVSQKDSTRALRVWVAGCATGEEAFSIGMLLLEEAARQDVSPEFQIFATDMDARALAVAREGLYPVGIASDVNEDRLRNFFQRDGDEYRVRRELRDIVLFANHSLLKDPPFSRVNLVSCRNLLIYLNRELQQQVLTTFNYTLNPGGYLFLGSSESAEHPDHLFRAVDREARLFQTTGRTQNPPLLPRLLGIPTPPRTAEQNLPVARGTAGQHREALETAAPPSILVDRQNRVLHLSETAGRYLQPAGGALSAEVTELVREEIRFDLRSALDRAFENNLSVLSAPLMVRFNGDAHRMYFQVKPIAAHPAGDAADRALILFIEGGPARSDDLRGYVPVSGADGEVVRQLHQELENAHASMRTMREESEAAHEELRAANEELQSINEEYRSTAEELETSKEELQSINEELQTVNSELKLKLDSVSRTNSDLQNLMAAIDYGTLFLNPDLRIKRFTPRTTELFNVTQSDIGRPITDFTNELVYPEMVDDARQVLSDLLPIEREVQSRRKGWYMVRLRPYRTVEDKIDGVVATFVDITERKATEARLELLLGELTHRVKNMLTVVQSIVHQSARGTASKEEFVANLDGRIAALTAAHNLLVQSEWHGADLEQLIGIALAPYTGNAARLSVAGEPVLLPPDVATPLGLVLHELGTNAVKYGALSNDAGSIQLTWTGEHDSGASVLRLRWREHNGPTVPAPARRGFGTSLIQRAVPGAEVTLSFEPEGLECTILLPAGTFRSAGESRN